MPGGTIVFWHNRDEIVDRFRLFTERLHEARQITGAEHREMLEQTYQRPDDVSVEAQRFRQIIWEGSIRGRGTEIDFGAKHPDPVPPGLDGLSQYLQACLDRDIRVWVAAGARGEEQRGEELLSGAGLDEIATLQLPVSGGFVSSPLRIALLTSHELFQRRRRRARHTRFRRRSAPFDRTSLRRGDLVVHSEYGIGMYEGMQTIKVRGQPRECLRIKYRDDVTLFVRVENFGLVEKYVGSESARPRLSKLGGSDWSRAKKRTRRALKDMAADLIKLYAERKVMHGHSFPSDTHWQREMEASFEFDDTPDQVTTTLDVKKDLEATSPMDRLLCGDVGFGKTEVAVRAAFKVVQDSFQVAVLAPTTILVQQHLETFKSRLSAYPVRIEVLSRFRSPGEQREVVRGLKSGEVDIVIGTHRLLSRDVAFRRLGLVIIDEEHRFGVRHKEKLKQFKTNVEVLTLTATPIPRTLHLALTGARDTSLINTPPVDRLPVQTEVHNWSEELIRDAILREIDRQGQVFFLHNRVKSIHSVKNLLERLVPELRYGVAHGQLPEKKLERVIADFLRGRYDVLVTTMIIESGIDMPNVNTLIVNRADCFGLAQLYQLRGRIGRSNRQAYAYLLTPPGLSITSEARRRLATITELTELGSGMKVAMRDLEIRGAGNLLGAQQSGYINTVGFDMYTRLLNEEISRLKDEPAPTEPSPDEEITIDFNDPAIIPTDYIDDGDLRYDFYRRLAEA
ncbi:MAG TPA: transcription-repair coupling factor, partial [Bacteroidetes bacterium]|nr:transcription-repair coupling factor [Bacteroidota bacterium]